MRTMKMQTLLVLVGMFSAGCGSASSPVSPPPSSFVGNSAADAGDSVVAGAKFKTPQDALSWIARFYKKNDIDIDDFRGQLESLYQSGVSLGHIFILARLSYVTGIDPVALLTIKEGDSGWTAVMDAFQIQGLGVYSNLGDLLRNNPGSGIVDGTPGTK